MLGQDTFLRKLTPPLKGDGDEVKVPLTLPLLSRKRSRQSFVGGVRSFKPLSRSWSNRPAVRKALIVLGPSHSGFVPPLLPNPIFPPN